MSNAAELRDAMTLAKAGGIVVLGDGTYVLDRELRTGTHGTMAAPIIVCAEHPKKAVIESNGAEEAFRLVHQYWRLEDLVIKATKKSTYAIKLEGDAQGCRITRCGIEVGAQSECAIKSAGNADGPCPDRCVVEGCLLAMPAPTSYAMAEGIDVVACHGWIVRSNRVRGFKTITGGTAFGIMLKGNSKNALIEKNVVDDCFIGISLGGGGTGPEWVRDHDTAFETRKGVVQYNVVSNSQDVALYLYAALESTVRSNHMIGSYLVLGDGGSSIDVRMAGSTALIANNVLDKKIRDRDGGAHTESGNLYLPPRSLGRTAFFPA